MNLPLLDRKRFLLVGGGTLILLVFLITATIFLANRQNFSPQPTNQQQKAGEKPSPFISGQKTSQPIQSSSPPPTTFFQSYSLSSSLPVIPASVSLYSLKTIFKEEEIKAFASRLGLTQKQGDTYFNLDDMYKRGMMTFDKTTGSFSFQSYGVLKPQVSVSGQSPIVTASSYLTYLFPDDPTLSCSTTYQKKETEAQNITYVECHRDWTKTGGVPILNPVGVLNIKEEQKLSGLVLGSVDSNTPSDPSIVATSNETDGKTRPNDFNTVTFGIDTKGNRIVSIDSNVRWIDHTSSLSQADLVTPQEALTSFMSHSSDFALTIPAGSGSVDWNKVYKDNKAISKQATITDYLLTYLEKPQGVTQTYLTPMYVIRGVATLETGYTVRFIETLPATRNNLSFLSPSERGEALRFGGQVAGTTSSDSEAGDTGQKQGGFGFESPAPTEVVTLTPSPTLGVGVTVTPTGGNNSFAGCQDINVGTDVTVEVPGLGMLTMVNEVGRGESAKFWPHTFYFKSATFSIKGIKEVKKLFFQLVVDQYVINLSRAVHDYSLSLDSYIANETSTDRSVKKQTLILSLTSTILLKEGYSQQYSYCQSKYVPPHMDCSDINLGGGVVFSFNKDTLKENYDNVSEKFYTAYEQGKVNEWAAKPNIFPAETLQTFIYVFIDTSFSSYLKPACYISGASPSLYLYPIKPTNVKVVIGSSLPLSYSYPGSKNNEWNVKAYPDGKIVDLSSENKDSMGRLYYEYEKEKVTFDTSNGKVVRNNVHEIDSYLHDSAQKLGLNTNETSDLLTDIHNVLSEIKGDYVMISLVNQKEVEEKLPLTISPKPDHFYRIHFVLSPASSFDYLKSKLLPADESFTPLVRDGFTVVEVGGRVK